MLRRGTVIFFSASKGYGYAQSGGMDVYFHAGAVEHGALISSSVKVMAIGAASLVKVAPSVNPPQRTRP